ncbi:MAG: DUF4376 domain-containing protein [Acetobacteraceae bacterium]|nr:DUF4376 domain-containing protein [Acetobacteraceae bacterium]
MKTYLDGVLIADDRSEAEVREEALARVAAGFDLAIAAGMPWAGKVLQIDDASRANLTSAALGAQIGLWPPGGAWRMADNSFLALTAPELVAMAGAAMGHYLALRQRMWARRDAARAAKDRDEADRIVF